jgi:hypothetical protein
MELRKNSGPSTAVYRNSISASLYVCFGSTYLTRCLIFSLVHSIGEHRYQYCSHSVWTRRSAPGIAGEDHAFIHPPSPSPIFTGREEILLKMEEHLVIVTGAAHPSKQKIFVLVGLGGSGKTQIALKFIEVHNNQYV